MPELNPTDTRTVRLELTADTEIKLREKAKTAGLPLEVYLQELAERLTSRTPEQVLADRDRVLRTARRGRPLPEGKTLADVVAGTWPGDESDEEIREILEKLS